MADARPDILNNNHGNEHDDVNLSAQDLQAAVVSSVDFRTSSREPDTHSDQEATIAETQSEQGDDQSHVSVDPQAETQPTSQNPRQNPTQYVPSDENVSVFKRRKMQRCISAPPDAPKVSEEDYDAKTMNWFRKHGSDILPPPDAPLYLQNITYMQRFGVWVTAVEDEGRRNRLIDTCADRMENVWLVGMNMGLIPQKIEEHVPNADETNAPIDGRPTRQSNQQLAADIIASTQQGRNGLQPRKRKLVDPMKDIVLRGKGKNSVTYAVTVGELHEADIQLEEIDARILAKKLDKHDELMLDTLEMFDIESIRPCDWYTTGEKTTYNTSGRDLMIYCLWEVQNQRAEIETLRGYNARFTAQTQFRNNQARIINEQELHDRFLALALLLHETKDASQRPSQKQSPGNESQFERDDELTIGQGRPEDAAQRTDSGEGDCASTADPREVDRLLEQPTKRKGDKRTNNKDAAGIYDEQIASSPGAKTAAPAHDQDQSNEVEVKAGQRLPVSPEATQPQEDHAADQQEVCALSHIHKSALAPHSRHITPVSSFNTAPAGSDLDLTVREFIDSNILPQVNRLLNDVSYAPIANGTRWNLVKEIMKMANIKQATRNSFTTEIRNFQNDLRRSLQDADNESITKNPAESEPPKQEHVMETVDVSDLPSREEVVQAIPNNGLTPQEFNHIFGARVDPNDLSWPTLLRSVAYMDKAETRWFVKPGVSSSSLVNKSVSDANNLTTLSSHSSTSCPLSQPSEHASRQGILGVKIPASKISWSTAPGATTGTPKLKVTRNQPSKQINLKIRPGFDPKDVSARHVEVLKGFRWRYLKDTTIAERMDMEDVVRTYVKERIDFDREKRKQADDVRANVPDRFGSYDTLAHPNNHDKNIIHGIWDNRNKTRVQGAQWFYDGKDGEWVHPVIGEDSFGYMKLQNKAELDAQSGASQDKLKQKRASAIELDSADDGWPVERKGRGARERERPKGKGKKGKISTPLFQVEPRGTKRKAEEQEGRPKRSAARGKNYAGDDSDGDWRP